MVTLSGFRPPQFSEDVLWLPPWLQPCGSSEQDKEGKSQFTPAVEELPCQNTAIGDATLSSSDKGRYKSCRLFLSAEDNSPLTYASSSGNVPIFHLHLSLDSNSENTQTPCLEMSHAEMSKSDHALPMLRSGASSFAEEKANQSKHEVCQYASATNLPPILKEKSDNFIPLCTSNALDNEAGYENNVRLLEVIDMTAAIELSIAASEALLIHQVIDSGERANPLSAASVLEVALRLKQARIEGYEEASNFWHDVTSDNDYLSDLDDSVMKNAYEEVGLTVCASEPCSDMNISHVKDTYSIENYQTDEILNHNELERLEVDDTDIYTKQWSEDVECPIIQLKEDLALERYDNVKQNDVFDDLSPGLGTSNMVSDMNLLAKPENASTTKKVGFAMEDFASIQVTVNSSPQAMISKKIERNELTDKAQGKFQSRWFGGWTQKNEVNAFTAMEHNNARTNPEYVNGETSMLSESADIVPDENSFVQNQYKDSGIASQSSLTSKCLRTESIAPLVYEDVMNSSTPSTMDPLCSAVPCSISSENACSALPQNADKTEEGNCFIPVQQHIGNKLPRSSSVSMEFIIGGEPTGHVTGSEGSHPITRRQVTSLRNYSTLPPSDGAYMGDRNRAQSFPQQNNVNNIYPAAFQSSIANTVDKEGNFVEMAKDKPQLIIHTRKETNLPLNMNHETKFFQAFRSSLFDNDGEENPKNLAFQDRDDEVLQINNLENAEAHNGSVPGRKHVRFAEANGSFPNKRKLPVLHTTYTNCSTRRSKWLSNSSLHSEFGFKDKKRRPNKSVAKSLKKLIFQNIKFLVTGFSGKKEKEIEGLIRINGGIVLSDIPSTPSSRGLRSSRFRCQPAPVIICSKKLQTVKFLYGCAIKACMLTVNWLQDSIYAGSVLPTKEYMILPSLRGEKCSSIGKPALSDKNFFENVGIMLHGKPTFCNKMAKVIKHGGGLVSKTLHFLVQNLHDRKISAGALVTEDESRISRHLKQCASELKIPLMPDSWIIESLYAGELLPFIKNNHLGTLRPVRILDIPVSQEMSQEI